MNRITVLLLAFAFGAIMNLPASQAIEMKLWETGAPTGVTPKEPEKMVQRASASCA